MESQMIRIPRLLAIALAGALFVAACGDSTSTTEPPAATQDEMADDEMADDEMADDEMADDEMADDEMADDEMADDEMADDEMADDEMAEMNDLMSVIIGQGDLNVLDELIHAAGLNDTLHNDGPFTVFAPTDAAFAAYFNAMGMTAEDLATDADALADLLRAHIVDGTDDAEMVMGMDGQSFPTLAGSQIDVLVDGDTVTVGGATVLEYDIAAGNGVVHVIDMVLAPAG
jgi:pentapeptide MXKDX repeat protein